MFKQKFDPANNPANQPSKKATGFQFYVKHNTQQGDSTYDRNDRIYVNPIGYLYWTSDIQKFLGDPEYVGLGCWPNGIFAMVPQLEYIAKKTYKVQGINNRGHSVYLSCKTFLDDNHLLVANYIVSYPLVTAYDHPEIPGRYVHWTNNGMHPPTIECEWVKRGSRKSKKGS